MPGSSAASSIDALQAMWAASNASVNRMSRPGLRPEGSFTLNEYADRLNIPAETARYQIRQAMRKGTLVQHACYVPDSYGRNRPTYAYTVKHDA